MEECMKSATATIEPENILRELNQLWDQMEVDPAHPGGVLRACAMTLAVVAGDEEDAAKARRTIGMIMHDHPSRAIVLKTQDGHEMGARVFAECWMPFGGQQQICSEGVEITAGPHLFAEVARICVPLRAPDLPVVLWCRGSGAFTLRAFDDLFPLADKIVLDSSTASGAGAALGFIRSLRARRYQVADLQWTRLTGWREIMSHLFDDEELQSPNFARSVTAVRVGYSGNAPTTEALYFASWIELALPTARLRFENTTGEPGLRSVTLSGAQGDLSLTRVAPNCIDVRGLGREYSAGLPPQDESALMREELKILGPDPVFEKILR
jgi:glucose-6-phosphate dehydrogenase assembly protein OpcA